ncbi:MAG: TolC family protein [Acidobacteriota bacterium]|nr:TolC family protein [Acidobacteriota bacterium]
MKLTLCALAALLFAPLAGGAQTFPRPSYFRQLVSTPEIQQNLAAPKELHQFVVNGKLRLTLEDAVKLALLNNTGIRIDQLQINQAQYGLEASYAPFDPRVFSQFTSDRSVTPATNTLQGAATASSLQQQSSTSFSQTLETGTNYSVSFNGSKGSTNSSFYFLNPFLSSALGIQLTQPLLRNRGLFANRAPILIAQRNLEESRQTFEAQVDNILQRVVGDYWSVVGDRESVGVAQSSLAQAQASYDHDKRSLQLGALSPLDIYQSEAQVAQVRVSLIQVQYALKQAQELFRQDIGADLDPSVAEIDLDLVENPNPQGALLTAEPTPALKEALTRRPEMEAFRQALQADETSIRYEHNQMLPELSLSGNYSSNGIGGNQLVVGPPPVSVPGGFGDALNQLFHFHFPTYGLTLSLNLPIRNHQAEAALGEASVARERDLYQVRQEEQTIRLDVINSVHQLEETKASLGAARTSRDLAQKNLEAQQQKYRLGTEQVYFVLAAQTQLATAEDSLVQAEIGYQLAVAGLAHAEGTLMERYHVQIAPLPAKRP